MITRNLEPEDDDDSGEGWLATYSDLMTDLLAIFVILFSFTLAKVGKGQSDSNAAADATLNSRTAGIISFAGEGGKGLLPAQDRLDSFVESINAYIAKSGLSGQVSVLKEGEGIVLLRMADSALFESGRADINSKAEQVLGSISSILTEYADIIKMVQIEGHTDNRPINTGQFKSNWELSTSRAVNVLKQLIEISPLKPEKFSAVGYSEFHPIADNNTAAGRAQNRRVDFVIETEKPIEEKP